MIPEFPHRPAWWESPAAFRDRWDSVLLGAVRSWRLHRLPDFYLPATNSEPDRTVGVLPFLLRQAPGLARFWQQTAGNNIAKHISIKLFKMKTKNKWSFDIFTAMKETYRRISKPVSSISFLAEVCRGSFTG